MKAIIFITGRGMGGDAVNALNIARGLEKNGVDCELVLDHNAPGIIFKKNNWTWHKVSIPQAGGHAATKINMLKAGVNTIKASFEGRKLIKKVKADIVIGVIGGGAVIGCISAKLAGVPAVGIIDTPQDTKICTKLNTCIVLPEAELFKEKIMPSNVSKSFFPLSPDLTKGNASKALEKISELSNDMGKKFDSSKKTIIFSSGSSLFEMIAKSIQIYSKVVKNKNLPFNLIVVGHPLEEEYLRLIEEDNIINLGYIDWIKDLYDLADLAVLTDDGVMIQESMACELPAIALTKVKYGRYHNMESIFPGAVIETEMDNIVNTIEKTLDNLDEIKIKTKEYSLEVTSASDNIAKKVINEFNNSKS